MHCIGRSSKAKPLLLSRLIGAISRVTPRSGMPEVILHFKDIDKKVAGRLQNLEYLLPTTYVIFLRSSCGWRPDHTYVWARMNLTGVVNREEAASFVSLGRFFMIDQDMAGLSSTWGKT